MITFTAPTAIFPFKPGYTIEIRYGAELNFRKVLLLRNFEKIHGKMNQMSLKLQNILQVRSSFEYPEIWFAKFSPNLAVIFFKKSCFLLDACLFLVSDFEKIDHYRVKNLWCVKILPTLHIFFQ